MPGFTNGTVKYVTFRSRHGVQGFASPATGGWAKKMRQRSGNRDSRNCFRVRKYPHRTSERTTRSTKWFCSMEVSTSVLAEGRMTK